jgi:hypothetical protein
MREKMYPLFSIFCKIYETVTLNYFEFQTQWFTKF